VSQPHRRQDATPTVSPVQRGRDTTGRYVGVAACELQATNATDGNSGSAECAESAFRMTRSFCDGQPGAGDTNPTFGRLRPADFQHQSNDNGQSHFMGSNATSHLSAVHPSSNHPAREGFHMLHVVLVHFPPGKRAAN
jgi:hypothetical protein